MHISETNGPGKKFRQIFKWINICFHEYFGCDMPEFLSEKSMSFYRNFVGKCFIIFTAVCIHVSYILAICPPSTQPSIHLACLGSMVLAFFLIPTPTTLPLSFWFVYSSALFFACLWSIWFVSEIKLIPIHFFL